MSEELDRWRRNLYEMPAWESMMRRIGRETALDTAECARKGARD